ncbi:F0F1 ATP synthase subunit alpha [Malacoplasma iowae]|uniref:ATP synthase subunit alpha n=1 Tax=Malacoplasma iowae DK-CPA TaxID=1394179 RepID=A0A084U2P8_MALIO|nr:F0F1 ATP synthase subunit alpha [Malacoplasma iowae]EGZ31203.1 F0F1 ATP synthase subunit alpha [Malacoplasma iowae 695]KFB07234.1 F0F1-type ATP synthase, alpha subunit [Malacoplasma iowae DK-CPA]WPL36847.1 F0F1 ATP synthase subunit alpha [Malacoplasma iowae]WPL38051.1 F0F1 ATP synthase subunit alpha [Malacoplasma iowae]WPL39983.1 F0F1 ATP synthase subunit alpha [Malacoplasma iowae]
MAVSLDKFSKIIKEQVKEYGNKAIVSEVGKVINVGDGISQVSGLSNVMLNELVLFENGSYGMTLNLEVNTVGVVVLGDYENIKEGSLVKRLKTVVSVPVGDELIGRVINPIGIPIDGKGKINYKKTMPIEKVAPGVMTRQSVDQPLETGILSIDSMFPIGKGQRELIIGDKQTGKTTVALDAILNQKGKNVKCIYVAIGQKNSTIVQLLNVLSENDAMKYTTIVSSSASDLPSLKYLAPFAGITIAEEWMSKGEDVLIVYDDLSKHAEAYRTLSLLLRRPPGREAYPGDVFYLHSRLLERSGRVNKKNGGGSITALPIIETQAGDISAYIPTNVISITDGQLFMMTSLFNAGQRPAIDAGLSVSRVGSAAQTKAIKKMSGSLKLELAQFRELDAFSQFGSDLDKETKDILSHGKKVMSIIKQNQHMPLTHENEVLLLYAIKEKIIKWIPEQSIEEFKNEIFKYFNDKPVIKKIRELKDVTDEIKEELNKEFNKLVGDFVKHIPNYNLGFESE